jgi:hypothetical protein
MFASKGIVEHLARGVLGVGALAASVVFATSHPFVSIIAIPAGLLALRGCPTCWTIGLVETVAGKVRGRAAGGACADGSCALGARPRGMRSPGRLAGLDGHADRGRRRRAGGGSEGNQRRTERRSLPATNART